MNKIVGLELSGFKTYYKATVIKTVWYLQKIDIDHWQRVKNSEINFTFMVN